MKKGFVIAIDGPVASGKGTITRLLSAKLRGFHLDTGVFFRCVGLYCLKHDIDLNDKQAIAAILSDVHITLLGQRVLLNKIDVTDEIRMPNVSSASSKVGAVDEAQDEMVRSQRALGIERLKTGDIVVVEGRNIGTAVFPDAAIKFFLTASVSVRAQRRLKQIENTTSVSLAEIAEEIKERDQRDTGRKKFPLSPKPIQQGYVMVDNSHLSIEETVNVILNELKKRNLYGSV